MKFKKFIKKFFLVTTISLSYVISLTKIIESETLNITTYYPAPYGAYVTLLTTNNTYLARNAGNVGIGTGSPGFKLDVQGGSVRIAGRLGTNNLNPDAGYPGGWGGGIHTFDVYSDGGTIAAGAGGTINSMMNRNGDAFFSNSVGIRTWPSVPLDVNGNARIAGTLTVGDIWLNGRILNACVTVGFGNSGWSNPCPNGFLRMTTNYTNWRQGWGCANIYTPWGSPQQNANYCLAAAAWYPTAGFNVCCRIMY